ncbi:MAG: hypothetical protein HKP10_05465 [Kiritimatiellales bacterium]|nr:hypothetical protein [Pontiella sp.]NNJ70720.1 hypothetical protein [Kiritimatiellales bacterium]
MMNKYVRVLIAITAVIAYLGALMYLPPNQPFFLLGIGVVGLVASLIGTVPGIVVALLLIPSTSYIYAQFAGGVSYASLLVSPVYLGMKFLAAFALGKMHSGKLSVAIKDEALKEANSRLQGALSQVKELGGIHNLCGECKQILDDEGSWQSIDQYLKDHTKMEFSHCICPTCAEKFKAEASTISAS